jgi:hypothetical protein
VGDCTVYDHQEGGGAGGLRLEHRPAALMCMDGEEEEATMEMRRLRGADAREEAAWVAALVGRAGVWR